MILVDTSVVFDLVLNDRQWEQWSADALALAAARDALAINAIVYAELSSHHDDIDSLEATLEALELRVVEIPKRALFLAGHAFRRYRRAAGIKAGFLPDFFIGAHAAVIGATLLTRDTRRIRAYFPTVPLISPA